MAENTKIEWADDTANFWEGCTQISPACDFCYAKARAEWLKTVEWNGPPRRVMAGFEVVKASHRRALNDGQKRFVFVNSLSDFFDNQAPSDWRYAALDLMKAAPECVFLLLTKRVGNVSLMMRKWSDWTAGPDPSWPRNIWLGITVVNQEEADRDIPKLLAAKATLGIPRVFLSCEPLLGPIDLTFRIQVMEGTATNFLSGYTVDRGNTDDTGRAMFDGDSWTGPSIDWVIVGGESGPNARPMHPDWARGLRDQCAAAGVPFLFKQWGEWGPVELEPPGCAAPMGVICSDGDLLLGEDMTARADDPDAEIISRFGKKLAGRLLDRVEHNGRPAP